MTWLLFAALAIAVPTAYLGGWLKASALTYGSHSHHSASRPFEPRPARHYDADTGRYVQDLPTGAHREEHETTRWLLVHEAPATQAHPLSVDETGPIPLDPSTLRGLVGVSSTLD